MYVVKFIIPWSPRISRLERMLGSSFWNKISGGKRGSSPGGPGGPATPTGPESPLGPAIPAVPLGPGGP